MMGVEDHVDDDFNFVGGVNNSMDVGKGRMTNMRRKVDGVNKIKSFGQLRNVHNVSQDPRGMNMSQEDRSPLSRSFH